MSDAGQRSAPGLRRLIVGRSALVGILGIVPVPQLEELLQGSVRRGLLRRIAKARQVDVDEEALDELLGESAPKRSLHTFLAIGEMLAALRPGRLRWFVGIMSVRRVNLAVKTFDQATLFDHYCQQHHLGAGLDEGRARELRKAMELATRQTRADLSRGAFEAVLHGVGALAARATDAVAGALGPQGLRATLAATAQSARSGVKSGVEALQTLRRPLRLWRPLQAQVERGVEHYAERLCVVFDQKLERQGGGPGRGAGLWGPGRGAA